MSADNAQPISATAYTENGKELFSSPGKKSIRLLTTDGYHFYVTTTVLRAGSDTFDDILDMPGEPGDGGIATIQLTEKAKEIAPLLRLIVNLEVVPVGWTWAEENIRASSLLKSFDKYACERLKPCLIGYLKLLLPKYTYDLEAALFCLVQAERFKDKELFESTTAALAKCNFQTWRLAPWHLDDEQIAELGHQGYVRLTRNCGQAMQGDASNMWDRARWKD